MADKTPYENFVFNALKNFEDALAEAKKIWPDETRKEAYKEWASTMKQLEILDRRTRAAVIASLLPIIVVGEESGSDTALVNVETLFVALLESASRNQK